MRLLRLVDYREEDIAPVSATLTDDGRHYNVNHGQKSKSTWEIKIGIDDKIVKKNIVNRDAVVPLIEDYYSVKPIFNKYTKELLKDSKGFEKYYLSVNVDKSSHSVLLFINVPAINVKKLTYEYRGSCTILSVATDISIVNNKSYVCDAPIIMMEPGSIVFIIETDNEDNVNKYKVTYTTELKIEKGK